MVLCFRAIKWFYGSVVVKSFSCAELSCSCNKQKEVTKYLRILFIFHNHKKSISRVKLVICNFFLPQFTFVEIPHFHAKILVVSGLEKRVFKLVVAVSSQRQRHAVVRKEQFVENVVKNSCVHD